MGNMAATIYRDSKAVDEARSVMAQDISERTNLARSARRRHGNTKSKKVLFGSEYMSRKDWEQKNGEVRTIYPPMTLAEYKKKTDTFKAKYIKYLREEFGANSFMMSRMLSGNQEAASLIRNDMAALRKRGFDIGHKIDAAVAPTKIKSWNEWLTSFGWTKGLYDGSQPALPKASDRIDYVDKMVEEAVATINQKDMEAIQPAEPEAVESEQLQIEAEPTETQDESESEPVQSVDIVPIDWHTFKTLRSEDQAAYLEILRTEFSASDSLIGAMMGISSDSIWYTRKFFEKSGYSFTRLQSGTATEATERNHARWNIWLKENGWPNNTSVDENVQPEDSKKDTDNTKESDNVDLKPNAGAAASGVRRLTNDDIMGINPAKLPNPIETPAKPTPAKKTTTTTGKRRGSARFVQLDASVPIYDEGGRAVRRNGRCVHRDDPYFARTVDEYLSGRISLTEASEKLNYSSPAALSGTMLKYGFIGSDQYHTEMFPRRDTPVTDNIEPEPAPEIVTKPEPMDNNKEENIMPINATNTAPSNTFSRILEPGADPAEIFQWLKAGIEFLGSQKLKIIIAIEK